MADARVRFDLATGLDLLGGDVLAVWWRYVALDGRADPDLLARQLHGRSAVEPVEYGRMAQALNELFLDHGVDTFPVAYEPPTASSAAGQGRPSRARSFSAAEVRRDAQRAADRSVVIARRAAELHAIAADLLQACGHADSARAALRRAGLAERRAVLAASRADKP